MANRKHKEPNPHMLAKMGIGCALEEISDALTLITEANCGLSDCYEDEESHRISAMLGGAYAILKNTQQTLILAMERINHDA